MYENELVVSFERYFEKNNGKILEGDFLEQREKFYQNTIQNNIVYSDEYSGNGESECSIWDRDLKNKKILILDIESYRQLSNGKHYMLISGLLYDDNLKMICTVHDKVEVYKFDSSPYKREFNNNIDNKFIELLLDECDFIVVHKYGADIPAISNAYRIPEIQLKEKTLDTWVSCMQILGKQEKGFYSLINLYKNLIMYDAWVSSQKEYFIFGTPPMVGHLLEISLKEFDYFGKTILATK